MLCSELLGIDPLNAKCMGKVSNKFETLPVQIYLYNEAGKHSRGRDASLEPITL